MILKRDSSTQTHLTNRVCFNAATQTNDDETRDSSFSFSSYIDQFEQMTSRSNKSNLSGKSNFSNKSSSNSCFDTNCSKSNCTSLKHYLMNEAKFAGVYDDKQYWRKNNEVSDEDERERKRYSTNRSRYLDDGHCANSGDSSSTDQDADDEDANDSDYFANQDRESLEDENEDEDEETNDDMSNDNLDEEDSSYSDDDLADYFKNGDNLGLETKVRLQRMLSAQLEKRKRMSKTRSAFKDPKQFDQFDDELYDDDEEVLNSINRFINKGKKDPNDYLETSSFIFLNKSATFDSTDDPNESSNAGKAPAPLKRISSQQRGELDSDQSDQLPDHQATKSSLNGSHRLIVLPNASAIADKAEVIDPTRNLRDTLVSVSDLLRKELPRKPKKDAKKKEKSKDDKNKPKPPKRGNSLDSNSLAKPVKSKSANEKKSGPAKNEELEKFAKENIKRHLKKGGLNSVFKRKESLKGMLVWTKSSIKQPMIATLLNDNELKQEAINCFQLIQTYCGDRELKPNELSRTSTLNDSLNTGGLSKSLSSSDGLLSKDALQNKEIAFKLIDCAISRGTHIKDEIFVQLCRQTTENPNEAR